MVPPSDPKNQKFILTEATSRPDEAETQRGEGELEKEKKNKDISQMDELFPKYRFLKLTFQFLAIGISIFEFGISKAVNLIQYPVIYAGYSIVSISVAGFLFGDFSSHLEQIFLKYDYDIGNNDTRDKAQRKIKMKFVEDFTQFSFFRGVALLVVVSAYLYLMKNTNFEFPMLTPDLENTIITLLLAFSVIYMAINGILTQIYMRKREKIDLGRKVKNYRKFNLSFLIYYWLFIVGGEQIISRGILLIFLLSLGSLFKGVKHSDTPRIKAFLKGKEANETHFFETLVQQGPFLTKMAQVLPAFWIGPLLLFLISNVSYLWVDIGLIICLLIIFYVVQIENPKAYWLLVVPCGFSLALYWFIIAAFYQGLWSNIFFFVIMAIEFSFVVVFIPVQLIIKQPKMENDERQMFLQTTDYVIFACFIGFSVIGYLIVWSFEETFDFLHSAPLVVWGLCIGVLSLPIAGNAIRQAVNRAFAEYAGKKSPEDFGLTQGYYRWSLSARFARKFLLRAASAKAVQNTPSNGEKSG